MAEERRREVPRTVVVPQDRAAQPSQREATFVELLGGVVTLVFKNYKHHAELLIKQANEGLSRHNALAKIFNLTANKDEKMPELTPIEDGQDRLESFLTVLVANGRAIPPPDWIPCIYIQLKSLKPPWFSELPRSVPSFW
jgi:hypothetical protein